MFREEHQTLTLSLSVFSSVCFTTVNSVSDIYNPFRRSIQLYLQAFAYTYTISQQNPKQKPHKLGLNV